MKKFIECLLPVTACNLKCSYCYVIQEKRRAKQIPPLRYSIETIKQALTQERFGGVCYFSICGAGETLIPDYTVQLVKAILENGHYVNVTTNGTMTNRFQEIVSTFSAEELKRLHFAFSFHYLELVRLKMLDRFFNNIDMVRRAGCSFVVQLNLCDEYMPHLETIKKLSMEHFGALPQIAATRRENNVHNDIELLTDCTPEEYIKIGRSFDSPLFDFTMRNFNVKRKEFCYAGAWSYTLNLESGLLKRCYCSCLVQNIFADPAAPIRELAVGNCCQSPYCFNSSHFISQGIIPEIDAESYADLRNRDYTVGSWYTPEMKAFLSGKLSQENKPYTRGQKILSNLVGPLDGMAYRLYTVLNDFRNRKRENKD